MLSRPPTKISLTTDDLITFQHRRQLREAAKAQQLEISQETTMSSFEDDSRAADVTPAAQTKATRARAIRDQRIGVSNSRG